MRDYQKEFDAHPVKCVICGNTWVPHARHVEDGQVKDCKPDNLLYLEYKYEESLKRAKPTE
jgi:hypothetical protein